MLTDFREALRRSVFGFLGNSIDSLSAGYGPQYVADAEAHLLRLQQAFPEKDWPKWAVSGYIRFNREILAEELNFRKAGQYRMAGAPAEVVHEAVYGNASVMEAYYLVGLYLTYVFWPHHYELLRFFRTRFLETLSEPKSFAEWGIGHGLFSLLALSEWPEATGTGYDVSRFSLAFARRLFGDTGASRIDLRLQDVLTGDIVKTPVIICAELLEHVGEPHQLLDRMRDSLEPAGRAFLTAACNAAQEDHVTHFRDEADVATLIQNSGFVITERVTLVHPNRRHETDPPTVLAMVLDRT